MDILAIQNWLLIDQQHPQLKEQITRLAEDYKKRSGQFIPSRQIQYERTIHLNSLFK
nr:7126_t:CDS:2 [Entrophospora candida]